MKINLTSFISVILTALIMHLMASVIMGTLFWFVWSICGIGAKFANGLPEAYLRPSLMETFGIFLIINILVGLLPKFK